MIADATLPLFPEDPAPTIPPRPRRSDPAVLDAAANRMWGYVRPWLGTASGRAATYSESECRTALRECIGSSNGYEFARSLEDRGWEPDAALVAILDHAQEDIAVAHVGAVVAWVQRHGITTSLPPGTRVRARVDGKVIEGRLSAQRSPTMGYYVVVCDDGDAPAVNAEDVTAIDSAAG